MYVFVYGTLKKNCPNHYMLENSKNGTAEFICEAKTKELFPLIVATQYEVPFMLDQKGIGNHVLGEVYSVDEKMLATLDEFEGSPMYYKRSSEVVIPKNGSHEAVSAWIFTFPNFNKKLLEDKLLENYVCMNYDLLRSLSGEFVGPEEKAKLFKEFSSAVHSQQ